MASRGDLVRMQHLCSPCHANLHSCHVPLVIISTRRRIEDDVVDSMNQLQLDDRFDE